MIAVDLRCKECAHEIIDITIEKEEIPAFKCPECEGGTVQIFKKAPNNVFYPSGTDGGKFGANKWSAYKDTASLQVEKAKASKKGDKAEIQKKINKIKKDNGLA